jgi:drug/metabolite transporter (DMT)-like permease
VPPAVTTPILATPILPTPVLPGPAPLDDAVRGILLVAIGYVLISCADAAIKWALPQVGVAAAMMWRGVFGALTILVVTRGAPLKPVNLRLIATRSLLHCVVSGVFYTVWLMGMPLADSYAVSAASPLLMTVLAIPILGEQVGWRRWTSTALGFCGVLVMLQPGGALWGWQGGILLAAVVLMAVTRIWTRLLARTDTPATITFWLMVAHIPVGLALLPVFPPPGSIIAPAGAMLAMACLGGANAVAHLLFARAFGLAPVAVLAPFEYSPLIWGLPLGLLIWGDWPTGTTFAGAGIVVAAGLYNLYRERLRTRQARLRAAAA